MSVHRRSPLPRSASRGRLIVADQVLAPTSTAMQRSRGPDSRHEGLVLWLGRTVGASTLVLAMIEPDADHGPQHVLCDERAVGDAARTAHAVGLGVVAQVHSHPGADTRHSDGDDSLILMPFENMFSLVAARYGESSLLPPAAGLHQYQDGHWVQVANCDAMIVTPGQLTSQERR